MTERCHGIGVTFGGELLVFSATELLSSGVDLRTVAGRRGHGSGGATMMRVYVAWVSRADQATSELLAERLPAPPTATGRTEPR